MPRRPLILFPLLSSLVLGACATSHESGRTRLAAPKEVVALHSDVEVEAQLIFKPDASCEAADCDAGVAFQRQVAALAQKLMPAAALLAVEQGQALPRFDITTPGKDEIGTLSSASGKVVVFDGLRRLALAEPALAFLIAREMGHVMAGHHEENSTTSIAVSIAITLLFPVAGILQGAEAAYTASTLAGSLTSTAASFAGARIIQSLYRDDQRREADAIALRILVRAGWSPLEVDEALHRITPLMIGEGWMAELRHSSHWLDQITMGPPHQPNLPDVAEVILSDDIESLNTMVPVIPVVTPDRVSMDLLVADKVNSGWPGNRVEPRQAFAPVKVPRQKATFELKNKPSARAAQSKKVGPGCTVRGVRYQAGSFACARPPAAKPKAGSGKKSGGQTGGRRR